MCLFCELKEYEIVDGALERAESPSNTTDFVSLSFEIFGQKWGDSQITGSGGGIVSYSFASANFSDQFVTFDSFITDSNFQEEITEAFSVWEDEANIKFVLSPDNRDVDIRFGWRDIDGNGGVLGTTIVPSSGKLDNVVIGLDIDENWFLSGNAPPDQIDFSSTVIHEIGHAIGIGHSNDEQALMNAAYSTTLFDLQKDDLDAVVEIYGQDTASRVDVNRFYNPEVGGHFFTADNVEKTVVEMSGSFNAEGIGFSAISATDEDADNSVPVYRFFNSILGGHFFTSFENEKDFVMTLSNFVFEGVGFRAFNTDTSSTVPVYRFFNQNSGGHFFTANENEKDAILDIPQLRYEGEAFYVY